MDAKKNGPRISRVTPRDAVGIKGTFPPDGADPSAEEEFESNAWMPDDKRRRRGIVWFVARDAGTGALLGHIQGNPLKNALVENWAHCSWTTAVLEIALVSSEDEATRSALVFAAVEDYFALGFDQMHLRFEPEQEHFYADLGMEVVPAGHGWVWTEARTADSFADCRVYMEAPDVTAAESRLCLARRPGAERLGTSFLVGQTVRVTVTRAFDTLAELLDETSDKEMFGYEATYTFLQGQRTPVCPVLS